MPFPGTIGRVDRDKWSHLRYGNDVEVTTPCHNSGNHPFFEARFSRSEIAVSFPGQEVPGWYSPLGCVLWYKNGRFKNVIFGVGCPWKQSAITDRE